MARRWEGNGEGENRDPGIGEVGGKGGWGTGWGGDMGRGWAGDRQWTDMDRSWRVNALRTAWVRGHEEGDN